MVGGLVRKKRYTKFDVTTDVIEAVFSVIVIVRFGA